MTRRTSPDAPDAPPPTAAEEAAPHAIVVHLDEVLAERGMTLTELSQVTGITMANLSILKTGKARAVRFTTLTALCTVLRCQPGDLLSYPD